MSFVEVGGDFASSLEVRKCKTVVVIAVAIEGCELSVDLFGVFCVRGFLEDAC